MSRSGHLRLTCRAAAASGCNDSIGGRWISNHECCFEGRSRPNELAPEAEVGSQMRMTCVASLCVGVVIATSSAVAETTALAGASLRQAVAGKTVYISTPVGALPIVYRANGTMTGRSRLMAGYTGPSTDSGTWWIANDRLCQRWQAWLDGKQHCYRMQLSGNTVRWSRDDGRTGTATIR